MTRACVRPLSIAFVLAFVLAAVAAAQDPPGPLGLSPEAKPLEEVDLRVMPPVDMERVRAEDEENDRLGLAPRFAVPIPVALDPDNAGTWETLADGTLLWRLRISSPDALSINLGFTRYRMPEGGRLLLYSSDYRYKIRPFTAEDNAPHGELWTPIVRGDEIVVEVSLPASRRPELELRLTSVNHDYLGFGHPGAKSGTCNVDVACAVADPFRDQVRSVAVISTGGSTFCTGAMVNNTAQDLRPFFLTANHCGINSGNAASLVTYWNFENSVCRGVPGGNGDGDGMLNQFNTGSTFRSANAASDFTLVELTSAPQASFNVFWAGWDRTTGDFACTMGVPCVAIHHPNTDEKRITFSYQATTTTSYGNPTPPGDGSHIHAFWGLGVTEPGSSGSPVFSPQKRVIGQLHGGPSVCNGSDLSDYYGRFSVSWTGGGTSSTRLSNWLDPGGTGATTLDGRNQCVQPAAPTGLTATPMGANNITLSWTLSAGAATYDVYRSVGACPGGAFTPIATGVVGTTYADTTVSGGTTYSYRVTARAADNCESGNSNCSSATATGSCTNAPSFAGLQGVASSGQSACGLDLAWSAGTVNCGSAVVYNVYRSTSPGFTPGPSNRIATCLAGTSYHDAAVTFGTRYYYVVRAEDDSGSGAGPCAGGNEDGNTVRLDAMPAGPPVSLFSDDMEAGSTNWTTAGAGTPWALLTTASHSPTHSFFVDDPAVVTDRSLQTAQAVTIGSAATLEFWHRYLTEVGASLYDGGVLEYSTNGGATWFDILAGNGGSIPANAGRFLANGYDGPISSCCSNPLSGRQAWAGNSGGTFEKVTVNLGDFAGASVRFRWRFGSDDSVSATGWWVDDVVVSQGSACSAPAADFYTVAPCRVFDTRSTAPPALACGASRDFAIAPSCGIPPTALAVSLNVAVTGPTAAGNLRLYPAGTAFPTVSSLNYSAGQTRGNNAIVSLGGGAIAAYCSPSGSTHVIVDVNGYFE
jgi:hypothetical protein